MPRQHSVPREHADLTAAWESDTFSGHQYLHRSYASRDTETERYNPTPNVGTLQQHGNLPFGQVELHSAQPHSLGTPDALRKSGVRMTHDQLSHDHRNGIWDLSLNASDAAWPNKLSPIHCQNRRHLPSMERVPENVFVPRKRHNPQGDRSADRAGLSSTREIYVLHSSNDPFPHGDNTDPWHYAQNDAPASQLAPRVLYYRTEDIDRSGDHFTPTTFRDHAPFDQDVMLQSHLSQRQLHPSIEATDDSQSPALPSSGSVSDSSDEFSGFYEPNNKSEDGTTTLNSTGVHAPESHFDPSHIPDLHTPSANALHIQFANHLNVVPRSPDEANDVDVQSPPPSPNRPGSKRKKKSKMHECSICHKQFPRPSGLRTHENSHTGNKPFPCLFPKCPRLFAVRSNAKRHLRTHGILPVQIQHAPAPYTVGFSPPVIQLVENSRTKVPTKLKWIPLNPTSTTEDTPSIPSPDQNSTSVLEHHHGDPRASFLELWKPGSSSTRHTREKTRHYEGTPQRHV